MSPEPVFANIVGFSTTPKRHFSRTENEIREHHDPREERADKGERDGNESKREREQPQPTKLLVLSARASLQKTQRSSKLYKLSFLDYSCLSRASLGITIILICSIEI